MPTEEKAWEKIDILLEAADRKVQDRKDLNLSAALGVAVREFPLETGYAMHFTLKTNTLKYEDLKEFISCYNPKNRHERKEADRFRAFTYSDLMQRDKVGLDRWPWSNSAA